MLIKLINTKRVIKMKDTKKENKKFKIISGVFSSVGVCLIIAGIICMVAGKANVTPIFITCGFASIFICSVFLTMARFKAARQLMRDIIQEDGEVPDFDSNEDFYIETVKNALKQKNQSTKKLFVCEYCGGTLEENQTKSKNCGAIKNRS